MYFHVETVMKDVSSGTLVGGHRTGRGIIGILNRKTALKKETK
jgi:hypothetical protein